jgi:NADH-quinone oxidoreductase subunit G
VAENEWAPIAAAEPGTGDFAYAIGDFYLTNPIARASG